MLRDELENKWIDIIADLSMDGIIIIGKDENVVYINPTYCSYLHRLREDIIGKHVHEVIKNSQLPRILQTGEEELNVIHPLLDTQEFRGVRLVYVNRRPVYGDREIVGAIAYVKFLDTTQEVYSAYSIMSERVEYYKKEFKKYSSDVYDFNKIIGNTPKFNAIKKTVQKVSSSDFTVLLMGETGTGKDVIANALHFLSSRAHQPFVKINCAALPENLIESELFGYADGAFTGARKGGKPGKFEVANEGTLFLDEIGELPLNMQAKLLRVLQEGEIERVGETKRLKVDVRIVAASNQDLEQKVQSKEFRSDLFYRLNVVPIIMPPLRERKEDIPALIDFFIRELNKKNNTEITLSEDAIALISDMDLPGNIRELKNIIDRCYILCEKNIINAHEVAGIMNYIQTNDSKGRLSDSLGSSERSMITEILTECNFNITKASENLGIHRMTLYRKMKKHGIELKKID